jgi:predicted nuclease of predicted toxin-antitoxin system
VQHLWPGSAHVHQCGLGACDDALVWDHAKTHGFTIVTKDSDYEQRSILLGAPPKVVWLRTGNCTTAFLNGLLTAQAGAITEFDASEADAILVIT